MNRDTVVSLFKKLLLHEFSRSLNNIVLKENLSQRETSEEMGSSPSWFNDAVRNLEDIKVTSLLRVLAVLQVKSESKTKTTSIESAYGEELFNGSTLWLATVLNRLKNEGDYYTLETIMSSLIGNENEQKRIPIFRGTLRAVKEGAKLTKEEEELLDTMIKQLERRN